MMKFRAWDKEFNIMSEVKSIDYRAESVELSDGEPYLQDFSKVELMKSTGILDKDAKEIFEGDILGIETDEGKVKVNVFWDNEHALFMFESKRYNEINALGELVGDNVCPFKIIGNIYENPKLLEG